MRFSTQVVGNGALVQKRVVFAGACKLAAVIGTNNGADCYIQIHQTAAEPANAAVPLFAFKADAGRPFVFALPCVADLDSCTVVASSTLATYTASAGTPVTIQAILAS
jgi:hypothetical protein